MKYLRPYILSVLVAVVECSVWSSAVWSTSVYYSSLWGLVTGRQNSIFIWDKVIQFKMFQCLEGRDISCVLQLYKCLKQYLLTIFRFIKLASGRLLVKPLARFECPCVNTWVSTPDVVKILEMPDFTGRSSEIAAKPYLVLRYINQILLRRHFLGLFELTDPILSISL